MKIPGRPDRLTLKPIMMWLWIAAMMGLVSLLIYEILEHRPTSSASLSHNYLAETVLIGISFFLLLSLGLRRLKKELPQAASRRQDRAEEEADVQRVLIIPSQSLLGAGIKSLLSLDNRLEIRGLDASDEDALVNEIKAYRPNIVVLDEFEPFIGSIHFRALFAHSPQLRIVGVSTESGLVRVYNKNQYTITEPGEFARIITANTPG